MLIKSVIIDNIHYINLIMFNISTLLFSWFALLKLGCILYTIKYGNHFVDVILNSLFVYCTFFFCFLI